MRLAFRARSILAFVTRACASVWFMAQPAHAASQALLDHECLALKRLAWARLALSLIGLLSWLVSSGGAGASWALPSLTSAALVAGWGLWTLRRGEDPSRVGLVSAIFDGVLLSLLPLLFVVSADQAPPSFVLKNDEVLFVLLLAAANTLPMRAAYPLVVCATPALVYAALGAWTMHGGDVAFSEDWVVVRTSAAVNRGGYFVNHVGMPLVAGVLLAMVARAGRSVVERSIEAERRIAMLSRFFSPRVARWLSDDVVLARRGVERRIAVLFLDLHGFTTLTEAMEPRAAFALLGEVHDALVDAVFVERGTLDKFLGDGLMATFGALGDDDDLAMRAVRCALRMRTSLTQLNAQRQARGAPHLAARIGVHLGVALVGNVGSRERLEFTSIGDTVNTASRVEAACKELETDLLVTEAVAHELPAGMATLRAETQLRGKQQPVRLYTVA